jgi:hypothetical protein
MAFDPENIHCYKRKGITQSIGKFVSKKLRKPLNY